MGSEGAKGEGGRGRRVEVHVHSETQPRGFAIKPNLIWTSIDAIST